ncbi:hypothetical protein ACQY0O_002258 [Thecaphora frezii]
MVEFVGAVGVVVHDPETWRKTRTEGFSCVSLSLFFHVDLGLVQRFGGLRTVDPLVLRRIRRACDIPSAERRPSISQRQDTSLPRLLTLTSKVDGERGTGLPPMRWSRRVVGSSRLAILFLPLRLSICALRRGDDGMVICFSPWFPCILLRVSATAFWPCTRILF